MQDMENALTGAWTKQTVLDQIDELNSKLYPKSRKSKGLVARYHEAVDNLKETAESFLQGKGLKKPIKRKKKEKNYIILKKQKKTSRVKDIFDNLENAF